MASAGSPQPNRPKAAKPAADTTRKPLQVMQINRRQEEQERLEREAAEARKAAEAAAADAEADEAILRGVPVHGRELVVVGDVRHHGARPSIPTDVLGEARRRAEGLRLVAEDGRAARQLATPLVCVRYWCLHLWYGRESNPRMSVLQTEALPLRHQDLFEIVLTLIS